MKTWIGLLMIACVVCFGVACDTLLTETPPDGDDFESPFDGLSEELANMFAKGDENFEHFFIVSEGLGPLFNNASCAGCHPGDGRGTTNQVLLRFSADDDLLLGQGGPQLQDRSIPGVKPETLPPSADVSPRLPPPVFGVGLIEAIPEQSILFFADENDVDQDGISGRPNWVSAPEFVPASEIGGGSGPQLGRFGRKANVSSLLEQVTAAYHQDMGVTSDFIPVENANPQAGGAAVGDDVADPEIPAKTVLETVVYVRLLKPPARGPITEEVKRGEAFFGSFACASCHVPTLKTGPNVIPQLDEVDVNLYSDQLLHDMGSGLADERLDGMADGQEWRTAPLWGTRLAGEFTGGTTFFLHDGRATSLDEAIRLHGGEAQAARDAYLATPVANRAALIAFLESL